MLAGIEYRSASDKWRVLGTVAYWVACYPLIWHICLIMFMPGQDDMTLACEDIADPARERKLAWTALICAGIICGVLALSLMVSSQWWGAVLMFGVGYASLTAIHMEPFVRKQKLPSL